MNDKALNYTLNYLRNPHTRWEVLNKLRKKSVDEDDIDEIIDYLTEKGYIDDEAYMKLFIDYHLFESGDSIKEVSYKLLRKGIDKDMMNRIFSDVQDYNESEIIYQNILRKFEDMDLSDKTIQLKVKKYFYTRGFSYESINIAVEKIIETFSGSVNDMD